MKPSEFRTAVSSSTTRISARETTAEKPSRRISPRHFTYLDRCGTVLTWIKSCDPGPDGEANELRKTGGLHLLHGLGAVDLDRPRTDAEIAADRLVGPAGDQPFEHLAFARRQAVEALGDFGALALTFNVGLHAVESGVDRCDHRVVVKWLFEEVESAKLHRLDGEGHVSMSRDHDDGEAVSFCCEASHELQAVDPRHADVGDDAGDGHAGKGLKKRSRRIEGLNRVACGAKQKRQGFARRLVIVDDMDLRSIRHRSSFLSLLEA